MKHILRILLFLSVSLFALKSLHAQWEQIGWQGGEIIPQVQLGNTLYSIVNNSIYKSTDWGKTWVMFKEGLPLNTIFYNQASFSVHGNILFLDYTSGYKINPGLFEPGFYYCKEDESRWSFKKVSLTDGILPHILFWSADTIMAYRGGGDPTPDNLDGYYFSSDNGNIWQKRMRAIILDSYHYGFSMGSIFFTNRVGVGVYRTEDFGMTWKHMLFGAVDSSNVALYPIQDSVLIIQRIPFFFGDSKIFRSTDFGSTYVDIGKFIPELSEIANIDLLKKIGKRTIMVTDNGMNAHRVFLSNDSGEHWNLILSQDTMISISNIFGSDNNYIMDITGLPDASKGHIYSLDSSFTTFTPVSQTGGLSNQRKLVSVSGTTLFALTDAYPYPSIFYDSILVSTDNGTTWIQRKFFDNNKLNHSKWVQDGNILYASGIRKDSLPCIFKSIDGGNNWFILIEFSNQDIIGKLFISGDTMLLEHNSDLLLSIDNGRSWIERKATLSNPLSGVSSNQSVIISPFSEKIPTISYSLDFGNSWKEERVLDGSFDQAYGSFIYGDHWFAAYGGNASEMKLYHQSARNTPWKECNGLSNYLLCIPSCDENGILYATGYIDGYYKFDSGRSAVYYSLDSGSNWKQLGDYVTNSPDVFIGSDYLFLAGPTELWRGPKPTNTSSVAKAKSISSISINDCYPNPAASEMHISYSIPKRSNVALSVFDMTGKEIATIASEKRDAGSYEVQWDSRALPNGSYILKLTACGESVTKVVEIVR